MATTLEQRTASTMAAVDLDDAGRRIEADGAAPQDVERAIADGAFHVLQSRPVTTSGEDTGQDRVIRRGLEGVAR